MRIRYTLLFSLFTLIQVSGQRIDPTFRPDILRPGVVSKVIPLANGDVLVAGDISNINGDDVRGGLVRITGGGARVPGFSVDGQLTIHQVWAMQQQGDKIILLGFFRLADGTDRRIVRLHADGSLDSTLRGPASPRIVENGLAVLPNGKYFLATIPDSSRNYRIELFLEDGRLDPGFTPVTFTDDYSDFPFLYVDRLLPMGDASVLVVGQSMRYQDRTQDAYRIDTRGEVDENFELSVEAYSPFLVTDAAVSENGKIAVLIDSGSRLLLLDDSGNLLWKEEVDGMRLVRFLDENRLITVGNEIAIYSTDGWWQDGLMLSESDGSFYDMAVSGDGLLIGGGFRAFRDREAFGIVRLKSLTGGIAEDGDFTAQLLHPGRVNVTFPQPDGRLIVAGDFVQVDQQRTHHLTRLEWDGSLDPTFKLSTRAVDKPYRQGVQLSNGRMLLAGPTGSTVGDIELIDPDGVILNATIPFNELDTRTSPDDVDYLIKDRADRVYAGTATYSHNPDKSSQLIKRYTVGENGGVTEALNYGEGVVDSFGQYYGMLADPEGGLYLYGERMRAGGSPTQQIVKLDAEGRYDPTFMPDLPDSVAVRQLVRLPSGGMIVAAMNSYAYAGGFARGAYLFKLREDGSRVPNFGGSLTTDQFAPYIYYLHYSFDGRLMMQSNATDLHGLPVARIEYIDTTYGAPAGPVFVGQTPHIEALIPSADTAALYLTGSLRLEPTHQHIVRVIPATTSVRNTGGAHPTRLTLAPNPSSGQPLLLSLHPRPAAPTLSYWVYELTSGRLLQRGYMENTENMTLPLTDDISNGSYVLKLADGQRTWINKFIRLDL